MLLLSARTSCFIASRHMPPYRAWPRPAVVWGSWASKLASMACCAACSASVRRWGSESTDAATRFAPARLALPKAIVSAWPAQAERILVSASGTTTDGAARGAEPDRQGWPITRARLAGAGLSAQAHPTVPKCAGSDSAVPVDRLPVRAGSGLGSGRWRAAGAACLDLRQGRVLGACAAPGGKQTRHPSSTLVAAGDGRSTSTSPRPAARRAESATRRSVRGICMRAMPYSRSTPTGERRTYDRIIVDAPCSATAMRRHPDIRLLRVARLTRPLIWCAPIDYPVGIVGTLVPAAPVYCGSACCCRQRTRSRWRLSPRATRMHGRRTANRARYAMRRGYSYSPGIDDTMVFITPRCRSWRP